MKGEYRAYQDLTQLSQPEKLELLLKFRPAARVIFYAYEPGKDLQVLLGLHRKNQTYTLPGGRFEPQDAGAGNTWGSLWNYTLFRELREELGFSFYDEFDLVWHDKIKQLGLVFWRHPTTDELCLDLVGAVRCQVGWSPQIPTNSELAEVTWFPWHSDEAKKYPNVDLAVEMLHMHLIGRRPLEGEMAIRFFYGDFESEEHYHTIRSQVVALLA